MPTQVCANRCHRPSLESSGMSTHGALSLLSHRLLCHTGSSLYEDHTAWVSDALSGSLMR